MELPEKIIEIGETLTSHDFDNLGYAYCGYTINDGKEKIYFLPFDLKNKDILTFEVPAGFCSKFDTQLRMGVKRSTPLILASTLEMEYIDRIPLQLFADSSFTKQCLTLMNNSLVIMNGSSTEIGPFKSQVKRAGEWRNNLRLKLRNKMTEAKKQAMEK